MLNKAGGTPAGADLCLFVSLSLCLALSALFSPMSIGPVSYYLRNLSVSNTVLGSPGKCPGWDKVLEKVAQLHEDLSADAEEAYLIRTEKKENLKGEAPQQFRVLGAATEDPCLVPSIHSGRLTTTCSYNLNGIPHCFLSFFHANTQNTQTHILNKEVLKCF